LRLSGEEWDVTILIGLIVIRVAATVTAPFILIQYHVLELVV
jgi:hypothetical protein